jgi:copper oxidase (laccase) domain-containing protein
MDLKLVAQKKLQQCGVRRKNISASPDCTYCLPDKYYSFRKDRSAPLQAMMVVAGIK